MNKPDIAMRRQQIATIFIACGLLVFLGLWVFESLSGIISPIDRHAYPIVIGLLAVAIAAMITLPSHRSTIELTCYCAVACYMLLQIALSGVQSGSVGVYSVANTLQWLPVIYVAAFVFFSRRLATFAAGTTFVLSLALAVAALASGGQGVLSIEVRALFLNAFVAHLLILLCLSLVVTLREQFERAVTHARVMEDAANTDRLTGIANRRGIEDQLGRDDNAIATVILFDIDHFKSINDRCGHLVGDEVLFTTARLIKSQLHGEDIVGRWGGEEFLVLLTNPSLPFATTLAERIRRIVSMSIHPVAGTITLSAGIAVRDHGMSLQEAFRLADMALGSAKENGRDRIAVA